MTPWPARSSSLPERERERGHRERTTEPFTARVIDGAAPVRGRLHARSRHVASACRRAPAPACDCRPRPPRRLSRLSCQCKRDEWSARSLPGREQELPATWRMLRARSGLLMLDKPSLDPGQSPLARMSLPRRRAGRLCRRGTGALPLLVGKGPAAGRGSGAQHVVCRLHPQLLPEGEGIGRPPAHSYRPVLDFHGTATWALVVPRVAGTLRAMTLPFDL